MLSSEPLRRRPLHRVVFILAGTYNLVWGAVTTIDPEWIFRLTKMPAPTYPGFIACLGMVIGVYGILYLEVARSPKAGWLLAFVGFLGKVLGPIGMIYLVTTDQWPTSALWICVTNDFIWWIPFGLYLWDAWPYYRDDLQGINKPQTGPLEPLAVYPTLLGDAWNNLAAPVQRFHTGEKMIRGQGSFAIQRGKSLLGRLMAGPMPLPNSGPAVPVGLTIQPNGSTETWKRNFDGRPFVTHQHIRQDGLLAERADFVELWFSLNVDQEGALNYQHLKTNLCLGPLRIPVPKWIAPQISAKEWAIPGSTEMCADIRVTTPGGEIIIHYNGALNLMEPEPT